MKKMILTALAAMLLAVPAAEAQKVNKDALLAKIEKSDADIADAKKNVKSATWIARGNAFYDAAVEPTKSLFVGMDPMTLQYTLGAPNEQTVETVNNTEMETLVYPWLHIYIKDAKVAAWKQTQIVLDDAIVKAIEAYNKAVEIDPKAASKVANLLKNVSNFCKQDGDIQSTLGNFAAAAKAYETAFAAQSSPAWEGQPEASLLYYAGYYQTMVGAEDKAQFVRGAENLAKAIELGFNDEEGNIYYYPVHCYYGQKEDDKAFILKGKEALLKGMEKFPKNSHIIESLIQLYTAEEGMGDPADLVSIIDNQLKEQPENVDLWFGRGRVFYALKNYDESINSFHKVVELAPDMYEGNYFLGVFYTYKAEVLQQELNARQYSSQAAYDEDLKDVNAIYKQALPWFEKAHEINPKDPNSLELLKSIYFRLRDEGPEMEQKYETYNYLFKQLQ